MKKQAITLLEIIISVTIISMLMILLFSVIAKKAKAVAETTSGTFYCFKDAQGRLNQLVELTDGTKQEMVDIAKCNFNFPNEATNFTVYVIGGGGGGGKISASSGYTLSPTYTHEMQFLNPIQNGCAKYPTLLEDEITLSELKIFPYACESSTYYNCSQGNTNTRVTNTDTQLQKMMDNDAYEMIVLKNRSLFVRGGANSNAEQGAFCTFRVNLSYGENISQFFDGTNEYDCERSVLRKNISASSWKFTTNEFEVTAQGKTFFGQTYVNEHVHYEPHCNSKGSVNPINRTDVLERQNDKIEYITITPVIQYGTGGKAGTYITNTSLKFAGKNIIIPKSNIGDGGKAGESGQATTFEEYNIKAQGGAAGTVKTTTFETSIDNYGDGFVIKGADLVSTGYGQYVLSDSRKKTKTHEDNTESDGQLSQYAQEKVIPGVIAQKQHEYKGIGAKCDATQCIKATSPRNESFGSGGGGGSSKVTYDPYYRLIYKKPNYDDNTYIIPIDVTNTPELEYADGSAGMGGAIVIKW